MLGGRNDQRYHHQIVKNALQSMENCILASAAGKVYKIPRRMLQVKRYDRYTKSVYYLSLIFTTYLVISKQKLNGKIDKT